MRRERRRGRRRVVLDVRLLRRWGFITRSRTSAPEAVPASRRLFAIAPVVRRVRFCGLCFLVFPRRRVSSHPSVEKCARLVTDDPLDRSRSAGTARRGRIDDLRVWSVVLPAGTISEWMTAGDDVDRRRLERHPHRGALALRASRSPSPRRAHVETLEAEGATEPARGRLDEGREEAVGPRVRVSGGKEDAVDAGFGVQRVLRATGRGRDVDGVARRALLSAGIEVAKLVASDGAASDFFGYSVAIDGDVMVVGAHGDDDKGSTSGAAFVCQHDGAGPLSAGWTQHVKLVASDGVGDDWFGRSVAIDGDVVVVGAYRDDDKGDSSGSSYVFQRTCLGWFQKSKLVASDGAMGDLFGYSVAVSGGSVAIGAYYDNDMGAYSGSAYVFNVPFGALSASTVRLGVAANSSAWTQTA